MFARILHSEAIDLQESVDASIGGKTARIRVTCLLAVAIPSPGVVRDVGQDFHKSIDIGWWEQRPVRAGSYQLRERPVGGGNRCCSNGHRLDRNHAEGLFPLRRDDNSAGLRQNAGDLWTCYVTGNRY